MTQTVNRIHLKNNNLLFSNQIATIISGNRYLIISMCVDSCRADNEMSWLLANQQILWFTEFPDYLRAVCHISRYFLMSSFCIYQAPCSLFCKILFVQFPSNTAELFQAKLASVWGNTYICIYMCIYIYKI